MKFFGILIAVLALVTGILPQFTDCQSQGKAITLANGSQIPMKCHWTAKAEIAVAVPLLAVGAMMTASRRKQNLMSLGVMGTILGVFVMLLPTSLIGVCSSMMPCNTIMEPALLALGGLITASSLAGLVISWKKQEKEL